jgi:hypothetical protein
MFPMDQIAEVCRRYSVKELSVFGSVARGEDRPDSDVDLLVEFEPEAKIGLFDYARLRRDLMGLLGRRVDLVEKPGLKRLVKVEVLKDAKRLYAA